MSVEATASWHLADTFVFRGSGRPFWHALSRADVVAHDFGGTTALRAHLLHGCEYGSLTLIDPVALTPRGSPLVRHVRDHEPAFAGLLRRALLSRIGRAQGSPLPISLRRRST